MSKLVKTSDASTKHKRAIILRQYIFNILCYVTTTDLYLELFLTVTLRWSAGSAQ
jgi:hypothetical protein